MDRADMHPKVASVTKRNTPTRDGAVTRADVARYAGVSTAVVSYVMNGGPRKVAPETAARVREAIARLDYRPNVHAQALRRGTTEMIGLVLSDPTNPYFVEFVAAITEVAFEYGRAVVIASARARPDTETTLVNDLIRRQVDGLIVASVFGRPDLTLRESSRSTPIVFIDAPGAIPGHASLGTDGARAAALAVEHLAQVHHHETVGLVVGGMESPSADPREQGWQQALRAAGLPDGPVARVDWSREGGYHGGHRLLNSSTPPTAIFASSDLQAVGLLRAAHERGLRVPDDVAVIGFDGTKESEFSWPPLTVVAQPIRQMARTAVQLVLDEQRPEGYTPFVGELIVRRSCGCLLGQPPVIS
jgi:LacI family transcriptional regulator